jgi:hypothetical protein
MFSFARNPTKWDLPLFGDFLHFGALFTSNLYF